MSLWDDFFEAFAPFPDRALPSLLPYIRRLVDEQEIRLVIAMRRAKDGPMGVAHVADSMQMTREETSELLENCNLRGIVRKTIEEGETLYSVTEFPRRLFHFVTFEKGWNEFPQHIRRILSEWMHRVYYYDRYRPITRKLKSGEPVSTLPNEDILLLDEVLEMVDAADDFAVATCNCRSLDQNCDSPTETCIRFNEAARNTVEMGRGKRMSRDEMKDLIVSLDKKGLMHTGNKNWRTTGLGLLCSCCTCCCYPFRAGIELELKGLWPKSYYIAEYNPKECTYCGLCVRRCRFGAWEHDGTSVEVRGKKRKNVLYDPEKCWGCGLCATTCAPDAITMKALDVQVSPQSDESHVH